MDKDNNFLDLNDELNELIINKPVSSEIVDSFLRYAYDVISNRAIPDIFDGLKPVHRRILFGMKNLGLWENKGFKKSARVVGEVIGKYHPHGDIAIYDSIVKMAQIFHSNERLIIGHGNFGSIDGDSAAAMRYTEVKLSSLSSEILKYLDFSSVPFVENYDGSETEPVYLPALFPNLLLNGSTGIAVGMTTHISPHNLGELIDGLTFYVKNKSCEINDLLNFVKGPDYPTAGSIHGTDKLAELYKTGHGEVVVRGKIVQENIKDNQKLLVITEIPYQVNKLKLIEKIIFLIKEKIIFNVVNLKDESNYKGIRIVLFLEKNITEENIRIIINKLYRLSPLETKIHNIFNCLYNGKFLNFNLKTYFEIFWNFRKDLEIKKSNFLLKKDQEKLEIVQGLKICLDNIDIVINILKSSPDIKTAEELLIKTLSLTKIQANAVLEMKLQKIIKLEKEKIEITFQELTNNINFLTSLLQNDDKMENYILDDINRIKDKYSKPRKTIIHDKYIRFKDEDLIRDENILITISKNNYIKKMIIDDFKSHHRGNLGVKSGNIVSSDIIKRLYTFNSRDKLFIFSNYGRVYLINVYDIRTFSKQARGLPFQNLIDSFSKDEIISSIQKYDQSYEYLVIITKQGKFKKTKWNHYQQIRKNGKYAIKLRKSDAIIDVFSVNNDSNILIASDSGRICRFNINSIRALGRSSIGVQGIKLEKNGYVVSALKDDSNNKIILIYENGYGKVTYFNNFRLTNRNSKGVKTISSKAEKVGKLIGINVVDDKNDLFLVTNDGKIIRMPLDEIRELKNKMSIGLMLTKLKPNQVITDFFII
ncbi:DNA gyrase subunit A [Mycoplasma sp. SG1]|uniref:DNA gyrase subunit A n=1 Tax=Mycoplasma sp. SG1 TaxID=2810348 RepID=UPI0020259563|nr:DNA gyrase subunit A [Mycoplasma sp. SG1]URM52846.1 DNA gyrase subunit A [Mycoplasma sp. SG1]